MNGFRKLYHYGAGSRGNKEKGSGSSDTQSGVQADDEMLSFFTETGVIQGARSVEVKGDILVARIGSNQALIIRRAL